MKKLIALTLVVVCLGCFSLGCGKAEKAPAKSDEATTTTGDASNTDDAPKTDDAPVE